jgi:hypothetical protein
MKFSAVSYSASFTSHFMAVFVWVTKLIKDFQENQGVVLFVELYQL